ncbi:HNH endonuclease family protein [Hymenobacter terrenus]|uniref:hypothetical protein n=1 Tax=Hymenobacter terrenus TaxID=1629124 RepID=UPI0006193A3B|nr:hypothetical protein [Hymenobacter terrenus]
MIRLNRPAVAPAALSAPAVQRYLAAYANYQANPTAATAPDRPSGYRSSDLLTAFDEHFYAKCYLTEQKFASSWEMDVDHFVPFADDPSRVFDWNNLLPIAHKANLLRDKRLPAGGLLDPCSASEDVENDILYTLVEQGEKPGFTAKDPANQKAVNTAALLDKVHNGTGSTGSEASTRELRKLIERRYKKLRQVWGEYNLARAENDAQDIAQAEAELRVLLSRRASFTMLMRSLPFIRKTIPAHLLD